MGEKERPGKSLKWTGKRVPISILLIKYPTLISPSQLYYPKRVLMFPTKTEERLVSGQTNARCDRFAATGLG